jgi:hypothetical protein
LSESDRKKGEPGKLYKSGPNGEVIEVKSPYNGPEKLAKRVAGGGQPLDAVAHQIGKGLAHNDLAAHLPGGLNVYLGHIKAYRVEDGCGAVILIVEGNYFGDDGEISRCSGSIRVQLDKKEEREDGKCEALDLSHLPEGSIPSGRAIK